MGTQEVTVRCVVCHKDKTIPTGIRPTYDLPVVRDNYVCMLCSLDVKRVKVALVCSKCGHKFQTRILLANKDKYNKDWLCPACIGGGAAVVPSKKCAKQNCAECRADKGVCYHPELECPLVRGFFKFGNGDLYSLSKECTIMSVHEVNPQRSDIHCFKYVSLYKSTYLLSPNNFAVIKQRIGSKKKFTTNVIVYKHSEEAKKFVLVYDQKFERGGAWMVAIRDFLIEQGVNVSH